MFDEVRIADELIDDLAALRAGVAFVSDEGGDFLRLWRQAGEVEVDAAEEVLVAAQAARLDLHALPFGGDEFVDLVPSLRLLPREAGAITHDGDGGGGVSAFKASEDRCLTATQARHEAFFVGFDDIAIAAFEEGLGGDVFDITIGITSDHAELLTATDALNDGIFRRQLDAGHSRRGEVHLRALADPGFERFVVKLARHSELAAFMRHGTARFEQHERMLR